MFSLTKEFSFCVDRNVCNKLKEVTDILPDPKYESFSLVY